MKAEFNPTTFVLDQAIAYTYLRIRETILTYRDTFENQFFFYKVISFDAVVLVCIMSSILPFIQLLFYHIIVVIMSAAIFRTFHLEAGIKFTKDVALSTSVSSSTPLPTHLSLLPLQPAPAAKIEDI